MKFCEYRAVRKYNYEVDLIMSAIRHYMISQLNSGRDYSVGDCINEITNGLVTKRAVARLRLRKHSKMSLSEYLNKPQ